MKKTLLFLTLTTLMTTGCSKTWSGIKQDTHEVVENTREAIHEATAPDDQPRTIAIETPAQNVKSLTVETPPSTATAINIPTQNVKPLPVVTPPSDEVKVMTPVTL